MPPQDQILTADAAALARELEFFARTRVEGFLKGQNWSWRKGTSTEFLQHRAYAPGDDLRRLDWRVYARSDRLVTREYEEFTNLDAVLTLDVSGSMAYAGREMSKADFARRCAAMLAYMFNAQNDSFGLAAVGRRLVDYVRPSSGKRHMAELFRRLVSLAPEGETDLPAAARDLMHRVPRRSVFIVLSDCFQDPAALSRGVGILRRQGHDVVVFQVYDPTETDLEFAGFTLFRDLETGQIDPADPAEVRAAYRDVFRDHTGALRSGLASRGVEFFPLEVTERWDLALATLVRQRAAP